MPFILDAALNAALAHIADNANQLDIVDDDTTPTDLTGSLGSAALTVGDGNGDFTIADGNVSGRKLTLAIQTVSVTVTGTARRWVLSDGTTIYAAGTMEEKTVTAGYDYEVPAITVAEFRDAA